MFRPNTNKDVLQKAYEQYIYRSYAMLLILKINIAQNIKTIKKNIEVTKHPERFSVYKQDAEKALHFLSRQTQHFDLVFLDPPYAKQHIIDDLLKIDEIVSIYQNINLSKNNVDIMSNNFKHLAKEKTLKLMKKLSKNH